MGPAAFHGRPFPLKSECLILFNGAWLVCVSADDMASGPHSNHLRFVWLENQLQHELLGDMTWARFLSIVSTNERIRYNLRLCCCSSLSWNRPISQIPQCTCPISPSAPFRTELCTLWDMGQVCCGICEFCLFQYPCIVLNYGHSDDERKTTISLSIVC